MRVFCNNFCSVCISVHLCSLVYFVLFQLYDFVPSIHNSVWYSLFTGHRLCFLIKCSSSFTKCSKLLFITVTVTATVTVTVMVTDCLFHHLQGPPITENKTSTHRTHRTHAVTQWIRPLSRSLWHKPVSNRFYSCVLRHPGKQQKQKGHIYIT